MMTNIKKPLTEEQILIEQQHLLRENEHLHKALKNTEMMMRIQQEAVKKYKQEIETLRSNDVRNRTDFDREFDTSEFQTQKSYCFTTIRKTEQAPKRLLSQSSADLSSMKKSGIKTQAQFTAKALQRYLNTSQNAPSTKKIAQQQTQDSIARIRTLKQLKAQATGTTVTVMFQARSKNDSNNPEPKATRRTSYFEKIKSEQN